MGLVVFDKPATWETSLAEALGEHLSRRLEALRLPHEFVEDSRDTLLSVERKAILAATLSWIEANSFAAYHGTRLNSAELESIRENGLLTLAVNDRIARLERSLSKHPAWSSAAPRLIEAVERGGRGVMIGARAGQAHLTLSEAALASGFNHYLSHGSEFDQHIAHQLLGEEGVELLAQDGSAYILEFAVPGPAALAAAHRFFPVKEIIDRGEVPNLVNEFLKVLSYRIGNPVFDPRQLRTDCGLVFSSAVPAAWLRSITELPSGKA